jgi:hypothetical protein
VAKFDAKGGAASEGTAIEGAKIRTLSALSAGVRITSVYDDNVCSSALQLSPRCYTHVPGTYQAEAKGNDKLILYAWANAVYVGNFSKAQISMHNMGRAEKRASARGTMVSDYPSGQGDFNYHSGKTDGDACGNPDCDCIMFVSSS